MSTQKTPRMVNWTVSKLVRWFVFAVAFSNLIVYSLALWSAHSLISNLPNIIGFVGSTVVLAGLFALFFTWSWMLFRWALREFSLITVSVSLGSILGLSVVYMFFVDLVTGKWDGIRNFVFQSFLPEGNLLLLGGLDGALFLLFFAGVVSVVVWNSAKGWPARFITFILSVKLKKKAPKAESTPDRGFERQFESSDVTDEDDGVSGLSAMLGRPVHS